MIQYQVVGKLPTTFFMENDPNKLRLLNDIVCFSIKTVALAYMFRSSTLIGIKKPFLKERLW